MEGDGSKSSDGLGTLKLKVAYPRARVDLADAGWAVDVRRAVVSTSCTKGPTRTTAAPAGRRRVLFEPVVPDELSGLDGYCMPELPQLPDTEPEPNQEPEPEPEFESEPEAEPHGPEPEPEPEPMADLAFEMVFSGPADTVKSEKKGKVQWKGMFIAICRGGGAAARIETFGSEKEHKKKSATVAQVHSLDGGSVLVVPGQVEKNKTHINISVGGAELTKLRVQSTQVSRWIQAIESACEPSVLRPAAGTGAGDGAGAGSNTTAEESQPERL